MKAFFSRLHIGTTKDKEKDGHAPREKLPPLPAWPPEDPHTSVASARTSYTSFKPLPELVPPPLSSQLNPSLRPIDNSTTPESSTSVTPTPSPAQDAASSEIPRDSSPKDTNGSKHSRKMNGSAATSNQTDAPKKVAFISPSAASASAVDRANLVESPSPQAPMKTTLSRFQAAHGTSREPRASSSSPSNAASSSKTDLTPSKPTNKAASTRTASPYMQKPDASAQSLRSGTPYSQMSGQTSGSRILSAQSWSEVTEEDLVSNLGSRERTRQEVLFEIISSEERYVHELVKMKDTFIDPLLHPYSTSVTTTTPLSSTPNLDYDYYRSETPLTVDESGDNLPPIAARFMSPTPTPPRRTPQPTDTPRSKDTTPNIDGESTMFQTDEDDDDTLGQGMSRKPGPSSMSHAAKLAHPRSPYRGSKKSGVSVPFPSKSHHSLPPPPRTNPATLSSQSLGRQSVAMDRERNHSQGHASTIKDKGSPQHRSGMLRKSKKSDAARETILGDSIAPALLPDDIRICLEVIDSGVLDGHKRLSEALRKRYDDQFPLVRSLADVFVSNSDIFHGYATYVLHLERALEQVDAALSNTSTKKPKNQDMAEWNKVCKFLQKLEENAGEKGETGLAITLSKPFQRLLKYPLLFQNLLFHTDPSTYEYESTLQMVAEVESIVRSIEDEKIQKEDRDRTRDVFARIEGLDKVKQLAMPKPSRLLVEERQCHSGPGGSSGLVVNKPSSPPLTAKKVAGKSSFKRLSEVMSPGSKKDLWLVVFNDVVLQCQRIGTTSLPLVTHTNSRTNSLPELQGRAKYATTGRRNSHTKPRNMYKFIKIETWAIGDVVQPRQGVVSMEDVAKTRSQVRTQPRIVPMPDEEEEEEDDGVDSDDSDRKSKMSFSYWGADKVTVQKPQNIKGARLGPPRRIANASPAYARESSANAKFGTRLVSESGSPSPRPTSRRTQATATPSGRRTNAAEDSVRSGPRPEWNTSTRPPIMATKRPRQTSASQISGSTAVRTAAAASTKTLASEDSGVGLYRQMLAKDPSLNQS